jgi:hypothetical protein
MDASMQVEGEYICEVCGELIVIPLDVSAGADQEYVEDCPVCCHANVIRIEFDASGQAIISASSE